MAASRLVKAPKAPACCNLCGRTAAIFRTPRELEDGVRAALRARLGNEYQIRTRITDMLANRILLEV